MDETMVKINRTELAKKTDMDISVVSRFLTGKRVPDFKQAISIADALGISLDELRRILYPGT